MQSVSSVAISTAGQYITAGSVDTEAIEYLEKLVKIFPKDEITRALLGVAYGNLRDHRKAIGCFERALQINPQNAKY